MLNEEPEVWEEWGLGGGEGGLSVRREELVAAATKLAGMKVRRYEPERSVSSVSSAHAGRGQRAR